MTMDDESLARALELDRLIEAKRDGSLDESDVPAWARPLIAVASNVEMLGRVELPDETRVWSQVSSELVATTEAEVAGELHELTPSRAAAGMDALSREIELPDRDAVWSPVAQRIDADRPGELESVGAPWWRMRAFGRRRLVWGPLGAAAAVLVAVALVLAQPPANTAEAFVRDVEALSALAEAALADEVLTEDEKNSVADLAIELRQTIAQHPETLIELDAQTRGDVLATLATVTARLAPIADEELLELRGVPSGPETTPPAAADGVRPTGGSATPTAVHSAPAVSPGSSGSAPGRRSAEGVEPQRDGPPGLVLVAPVVASSVTSLHELADAVEEAGGGSVRPSASVATPGSLLGLCRDLRGAERGGCQRAINAAIAACSGAADRGSLDECEAASESAGDACEALLPEDGAALCAAALTGLESGAELSSPSGLSRGNMGRSTDDDSRGTDSRSDDDRTDRDDDD